MLVFRNIEIYFVFSFNQYCMNYIILKIGETGGILISIIVENYNDVKKNWFYLFLSRLSLIEYYSFETTLLDNYLSMM